MRVRARESENESESESESDFLTLHSQNRLLVPCAALATRRTFEKNYEPERCW